MTHDVDTLSVFSAARESPERDALVWQGDAWSYRALAERVAVCCSELAGRGVTPGARVAIRASNSPETVCALLALMELDAIAVLLHPKLTEAETQTLLDDAEPRLLLDPSTLTGTTTTLPPSRAHSPDATLAMLYTSGTTGRPKGAMLSRGAFVASAYASAQNLGWRDDDRWLLCLPVCHVGGYSVLTRCVIARRCVVLLPRFDADAVLASVARDRATLLSVVPTMLRGLLELDEEGTLSRLRAVLVGGAATPRALLEECASKRVRALTTYGLTEACSQVTTQRLEGAGAGVRAGSGPALEGVELEIVGDDGRPMAIGEPGRVRVRGPSVMTGYWRHPPLGEAWLETGDIGWFDSERNLHVLARRTDLIVTGGENVYPAEVEERLLEMPGVSAALVFGVPDERWGQAVAAAIVRDRTIGDVDDTRWLAELRGSVAGVLASHKRPRLACVVEALPMRATGKVDRAMAVRVSTPRVRPWPTLGARPGSR